MKVGEPLDMWVPIIVGEPCQKSVRGGRAMPEESAILRGRAKR